MSRDQTEVMMKSNQDGVNKVRCNVAFKFNLRVSNELKM